MAKVELWYCAPQKCWITERACKSLKERANQIASIEGIAPTGEIWKLLIGSNESCAECPSCPGVRALAKTLRIKTRVLEVEE